MAPIRRRRLGVPVSAVPWALAKAQALGLPDDSTISDLLVEVELRAAAEGDARALASVADRTDGKARQAIEFQPASEFSLADLIRAKMGPPRPPDVSGLTGFDAINGGPPLEVG